MQPIYVTLSSTGSSPWKPTNWQATPMEISFAVISTGGSSYFISATLEDPTGTYPNPNSSTPVAFVIFTGSSNALFSLGLLGDSPAHRTDRGLASHLEHATECGREGHLHQHAKRDRMTETVDHVAAGKAAWERLRNDRATFDDWIAVGRALVIGRTEAMQAAKSNKPMGSTYNRLMGEWLRQDGLDVCAQERYALLKIIEHLPAVEAWRDGLPELQRRRHNHPSLWHVFRRATKATTPARQCVRGAKSLRGGKPVYWPGDAIRRAAMALRECGSSDIFRLARVALEAAIRSEADLIELLSPDSIAMSAIPRRTDVVSPTGYVG